MMLTSSFLAVIVPQQADGEVVHRGAGNHLARAVALVPPPRCQVRCNRRPVRRITTSLTLLLRLICAQVAFESDSTRGAGLSSCSATGVLAAAPFLGAFSPPCAATPVSRRVPCVASVVSEKRSEASEASEAKRSVCLKHEVKCILDHRVDRSIPIRNTIRHQTKKLACSPWRGIIIYHRVFGRRQQSASWSQFEALSCRSVSVPWTHATTHVRCHRRAPRRLFREERNV